MEEPEQLEMLLAGRADDGSAPVEVLADLQQEVAAFWGLPLGRCVRVELRGADFDHLRGRLALERAPERPFQRGGRVDLRIGRCSFLASQIQTWLLDE